MRFLWVGLLSFAWLAQAAPVDRLILNPYEDLTARTQLSLEDLDQDLDVLAYAARGGYAGPPLENVLQSVRRQVRDKMSSVEFCQELQNGFESVRDGHLRASLLHENCVSPKSISAAGSVGPNINAQGRGWGFTTLSHNGQSVNVLSLASFPNHEDIQWTGFLDRVQDLKNSGKPFVLDLRGNRGGDDSMAYEMARILYGLGLKDFVPTPEEGVERRETPEALALMANSWLIDIFRIRAQGVPAPIYLRDNREESLKAMRRAETGKYPSVVKEQLPKTDLHGKDVFSAPLYVLIDRRCASSCENTVQFLEALPHRVLIGEPTAGAVEYGGIGKVILPNSRVIISLATFAVHFQDARQVEKIGYQPDVKVEAGQDALQTLFKQFFP